MILEPGSVIVHKLDAAGREVWRYRGRALHTGGGALTLEAGFNGDDAEFHGLTLRRGDRFVETFYADRWYNVFSVFDSESGAHKGWYCNITRPARIEPGQVRAEDLGLDLVVLPGGQQAVLDREEFEALGLSAEERRRALDALADLQALASARRGPFADPARP